jgi:hypothetical protein
MKALDKTFFWKCLEGGITFYPYQLSLGLTLRYWPDLYAPNIRIHIGPIKLWCYIALKA